MYNRISSAGFVLAMRGISCCLMERMVSVGLMHKNEMILSRLIRIYVGRWVGAYRKKWRKSRGEDKRM